MDEEHGSSDENSIFDSDEDASDALSDAAPAQPHSDPNDQACNEAQISEAADAGDQAKPSEEGLDITALEVTTSAHDDWLHRGPFLFDLDFHTYIRYTLRKPRPKDLRITDADRVEHVFLFDSHYALAASHWQRLGTHGQATLES